jgi:hypothetical protein
MLGVFVAVAAARLGPEPLKNFATRGDARRLALDLLQAQRRAISTGNNHYVEFTSSGGNIVGYTVYRRLTAGGVQAVDGPRDFPRGETITASHSQLEFDFEGAGLAAYQVTFAGANQTWRVTVVPATGAVRVQPL